MLALRSEEFAFQLTAYIGILNPTCRRRDVVKEGGSVKSQELILCKYKIRCREYENCYRSLLRKVFYRIITCRKLIYLVSFVLVLADKKKSIELSRGATDSKE
jgi:hypothetical protein